MLRRSCIFMTGAATPLDIDPVGSFLQMADLTQQSASRLTMPTHNIWKTLGAEMRDVVPDAPRASGNDAMSVDDIDTAYRLYAEEISQAWKTP